MKMTSAMQAHLILTTGKNWMGFTFSMQNIIVFDFWVNRGLDMPKVRVYLCTYGWINI